MSIVALFAVGVFVTLTTLVGIGLLVWGAVLDGRYEREVQTRMEASGPAPLSHS